MASVLMKTVVRKGAAEHAIQFQLKPELFSHRVLGASLAAQQLFELATSRFVVECLEPGDTFVDVGAHIGWFSVLASRLVGPAGKVYAFEPERANYERLMDHLQLNEIGNVLPYGWAVGRQRGMMELFTHPENDGGHALWDIRTVPGMIRQPEKTQRRRVFVTTLDEMFGQLPVGGVKLIKMDTEGTEMDVLQGGRRMLDELKLPAVVCEINRMLLEEYGVSERATYEFMRGLGYEAFGDHPGHEKLVRLDAGCTLDTNYVYNAIFVRPELARTLSVTREAEGGPQRRL